MQIDMNVWHRLIIPHPTVTDSEKKRKSELFAAVTLSLAVILGVINTARLLLVPNVEDVGSRLLANTLAVLLLLVFYLFARRGYYYQLSIILSILGTLIVIWLMVRVDSPGVLQSLDYLIIAPLFVSFFLTARAMLIIAGFQVVMVLLIPLGADEITVNALLAGPVGFLVVVSLVIFFFSVYRVRWDRQRSAELERVKERYRIITEVSSDYAFSFTVTENRQLIPEWRSDSFEAVTGFPLTEFTSPNADWLKMIHPDDKENQRAYLQRAIYEKKTNESESRLITRDGKLKYVRVVRHPVVDEDGRVTHLYGTVQDITDQHLAKERSFELALQRERTRLLRDFITKASHEFRTPISLINSSVYLLEKTDERREERFRIIREQTQMLTDLVAHLVTMVTLDSGVTMQRKPLAVNSVVNMATVAYSDELEQYHVELDLVEDLPLILGDAQYLHIAMLELLENAVGHTPSGGTITIRTRLMDDSSISLEIQDTGAGIEPEDQPYIFDRFYRADESHTTRGFGLGLPIVRTIVEGHNGAITVKTKPGEGTTFLIRLKVADQTDDVTIT